MNDLVKRFEGCRLEAYRDSGGVLTLGYGRTRGVREGQTCTQEEADAWLAEGLAEVDRLVGGLVTVPLTWAMREALVSFVFNVGAGNFARSTLLKRLNEGDYLAVPQHLCQWHFVKSRPLLGLARRRVAEAARFLEDGLP